MKTLKEIVIEMKSRKGKPDGVTKDGAYWEAVKFDFANLGGDGIGQSGDSINDYIVVRHYRLGEVRCYLERHFWHQNTGTDIEKTRADKLLECTNLEEIKQLVATVKINTPNDYFDEQYGKSSEKYFEWYDRHDDDFIKLTNIPLMEKSPDEE
jgi:hypothetical protein